MKESLYNGKSKLFISETEGRKKLKFGEVIVLITVKIFWDKTKQKISDLNDFLTSIQNLESNFWSVDL